MRLLVLFFVQVLLSSGLWSTTPLDIASAHSENQATSQEYAEDFIELLSWIYGDGILSQGGLESIHEMMQGIEMEGKTMLDIGSGLGMYDIYLAEQHRVKIIGIDPQESLIQKAEETLQKRNDLKGSVSFFSMENPYNLQQFPDNSFDVIFSKESILHVPYDKKENYFLEMYRVLKPHGTIIIMDWLHTSPNYSKNTKKMMEMDGIVYQLLTPVDYQNILKKVGFHHVSYEDNTLQHVFLSQQNIDCIHALKHKIIKRFGEEMYNYALESWTYQKEAFQNRELLTGVLRADK